MLINSCKDYLGNVVSAKFGDTAVDFLYSRSEVRNFTFGDVSIHLHTHTEVVFMISGSCRLVSENKIITLNAGSACVIPKGIAHSFDLIDKDSEGFSFQINIENNENDSLYYTGVFSAFDDAIVLCDAKKEIEYINDFLKSLNKKGINADNISSTLLKLTFLSLTEKISEMFDIEPPNTKINQKQKNERVGEDYVLENYIMDNYTKNITIDDIAEFVGYSSTYTARKIKKIYNLTYSELLMKLRMNYAWREIIFTDKHLFEISEEVGYNSYNGFGLAFKKFYKKTPEQVRNEHIEKL